MLKVILQTITITSAAWGVLLCGLAIRNTAKQKELKRLAQQYKYNAMAMQEEFRRWRKQYEKMETGDTNGDFLGSLDILHNNRQNTKRKTNAGTADTVKQ